MWPGNATILTRVVVIAEEEVNIGTIVVQEVDTVTTVATTIVKELEDTEEIGVLLWIIAEIVEVIATILIVGEERDTMMIVDVLEMTSVEEDAIETVFVPLLVNVLRIVIDMCVVVLLGVGHVVVALEVVHLLVTEAIIEVSEVLPEEDMMIVAEMKITVTVVAVVVVMAGVDSKKTPFVDVLPNIVEETIAVIVDNELPKYGVS